MPSPTGSMPAAVYKGDRTVVVEDVAVPEVGPSQVLVEVSHCGICGTDLHLMLEGWGPPGLVGGHEYSGVVALVGSEVEGWAEGDRVVGGPNDGCGECARCRDGSSHLCAAKPTGIVAGLWGAFAAYKAIDAGALYRVPDGLDLRSAALTEPVAVALRGVRRSAAGPASRVLVTGAGPIGLLSVAILRARGVEDITVSEPGERRKKLALAAGAARVVDPGDLAVPGMPMSLVPDPFDAALECSGSPEAMEAALANLGRAGTLVLSGTGMRRPQFDPNRIILHELTVTGTVEYTPDDYRESLRLLSSGELPTDLLIEPDDVPLDRLQWALEGLKDGSLAGKVMVAPHA